MPSSVVRSREAIEDWLELKTNGAGCLSRGTITKDMQDCYFEELMDCVAIGMYQRSTLDIYIYQSDLPDEWL